MKKTTHFSKIANRMILALTIISGLGLGIAVATAQAADWHGHARDARAWHKDHVRQGHVIYRNGEPDVIYAPPLVVEPPPPVYYPSAPGINIVVPLNIR